MRMGYRVRREVRVSGLSVDMIVERDGLKSPVEIKMRTTALSLREISEIIVRLSVLG